LILLHIGCSIDTTHRNTSGFSFAALAFPWLSLGFPLAFTWLSLGFPLGFPWIHLSCLRSSGRKKYSQEKALAMQLSQVQSPPRLVMNEFVISHVHAAFAEETNTELPPPPTDAELDAAWGDG
jgi:hypothetical protein